MIKRTIEKKIKDASTKIGVISIMGPRQSGKTTLVRTTFPKHSYFNLEDIRVREQIEVDPKGFLESYPAGIILDEVQKYPELLSYIQVIIDEDFKPSRFVITGSENLLLSEKVSQSLAGRVAIFELLPLSVEELSNAKLLEENIDTQMLNGFYPRVYDMSLKPSDIYPDYVTTYIERDVRQIKNIGNLTNFQRFLGLAAGRVGQLLNLSSLANDVGVDYKTVGSWISILESTYIAFRLTPFYENFGKRIIKSPKLYFYDTGLLCYLLGIDSAQELKTHYSVGNIFENLVIADIQKQLTNLKASSKTYFWRDRAGNEIDLIIKNGQNLYPLEIKLGGSFSLSYLNDLNKWFEFTGNPEVGQIIYTGEKTKVRDIQLFNWRELAKLKNKIT